MGHDRLKAAVRRRMRQTGESYTTARREVLGGLRATGGSEPAAKSGIPVSSAGKDGVPLAAGADTAGFPPQGHVFISYVREDSARADWLQNLFEAAGIPVWRDRASLWPGDDWRHKIRHAITRDALVFIPCFSSNSAARQRSYMYQELLLAIDELRQRQPQDPWLIPVRFDDCKVPDYELGPGRTLESIHWASLFGASRDEEAARLVQAVQRLLDRPAPQPRIVKGPESSSDARQRPQHDAAPRPPRDGPALTTHGYAPSDPGTSAEPGEVSDQTQFSGQSHAAAVPLMTAVGSSVAVLAAASENVMPGEGQVLNIASLTGVGSPAVLRILLGAQLRRLREAKRITLEEAGNVIRASHSKMSRLESGRVAFKDRDIVDLFIHYGVTDQAQIQTLRGVAIRANSRGWWHDYSDVLPPWFEEYISLEEAAVQISGYEVQFVPGLLQTEDYARAVTLLAYSNPKEISRRVSLRMARQARLFGDDPVSLGMVLDEAALSRPIGGPSVMRAQLKHLIEMAQRPHVTVQVLPFNAGGHASAGGPFSVLHFAESDLSDVVYLEQLSTAQYLEKPDMVREYQAMIKRLRLEAATPADTLTWLQAMLSET
jgi:transcriptional regulator with XRE-family HTH domain